MGRTPKPLRIAVTHRALMSHPKLVKLAEQGHLVWCLSPENQDELGFDLVIGPGAWYMDTSHIDKYLDLALKQARLRRYPKEEHDGGESEAPAPETNLPA